MLPRTPVICVALTLLACGMPAVAAPGHIYWQCLDLGPAVKG